VPLGKIAVRVTPDACVAIIDANAAAMSLVSSAKLLDVLLKLAIDGLPANSCVTVFTGRVDRSVLISFVVRLDIIVRPDPIIDITRDGGNAESIDCTCVCVKVFSIALPLETKLFKLAGDSDVSGDWPDCSMFCSVLWTVDVVGIILDAANALDIPDPDMACDIDPIIDDTWLCACPAMEPIC